MRRTILRRMCALLLLTLTVAYGLFCFVMYEEKVAGVKQQLEAEALFLEGAMVQMGQPYLESLSINASDSKRIT